MCSCSVVEPDARGIERHDTTSGAASDCASRSTPVGLRRALGRWDLTAIGVNQVIGGAVFALPAALAANTGAWSPWLVAARGRRSRC